MRDEKEAKPARALGPAILLAGFHSLLWIVLLGMMLYYVPSFVKTFADFDVEVPAMTVWVIAWSSLSVRFWYAILPAIAVLCAGDLAVLYVLYLSPKVVVLRWLWSGLMLLAPLALIGLTVLAIQLPMAGLVQQLR